MAAFKPGQQKPPGSGRKPGTPNRRVIDVAGVCAELDVDPARVLALIAKGDKKALGVRQNIPIKERRQAAEALLDRLVAKLKAIEITTTGGAIPVIIVPDKSPGASWQDRAQAVREEQQRVLREKQGGAAR